MLICAKDVLERATDFEQRAQTLALSPWLWQFLLTLDGRLSFEEVARRCDIDLAIAAGSIKKLLEQGSVIIRTVTLQEYREQSGASPTAFSPPFVELSLKAVTSNGKAASSAPQTASSTEPPGSVTFSLKSPSHQTPSAQSPPGSIGFKLS